MNAIEESERELCECDRPDELDNPHRHKFDVACVYWRASPSSVEDRKRVLTEQFRGKEYELRSNNDTHS